MIDPGFAAKLLGALYLAAGSSMVLAPAPQAAIYGDPKVSATSMELIRRQGAVAAGSGLVAASVFFREGMQLSDIQALAPLPLALCLASGILNGTNKEAGIEKTSNMIVFALFVATSAGNWLKLGWADQAFKLFAVVTGVSGVSCLLSPGLAPNTWLEKGALTGSEKAWLSLCGLNFFQASVVFATLAWQVPLRLSICFA